MNTKTITAEFIIREGQSQELLDQIEEQEGMVEGEVKPWAIPADLLDDYSDPQMDPLMIVTVSVTIGFLIKRISEIWLDHKRPGGQVIDTRGGKVVVRVAPFLDRETLVLQSDDGVEVFKPQDKDEAIPLLEKIILGHG